MLVLVDLSDNNPGVDVLAKISGIDGGIVKCTEGATYVNEDYAVQLAAMRKLGAVGHYDFARPDKITPTAHAAHFLDNLDWRAGEVPFLDLEAGNGDLTDWVLTWADYVEQALRVIPGLYTYPDFAAHHLRNDARLARLPLWWASWNASPLAVPAPWTRYTLWQYTDRATVPGIGICDLSRFPGTLAEWRRLGTPPMGTDERRLLLNDVAAIGGQYTGDLVREGVIDLRQYGAGEAERIAAYEKGVYHRFAGTTVAMVRETPGAFDIPDDESNASYDALYRRGKVVWY